MNELLALQAQPTTTDQLIDLIDELDGEQTSKLVLMLTERLADFHWYRHNEIREEGDPNDQQTAWCHDATLWSNIVMMMKNISDLRGDDDDGDE